MEKVLRNTAGMHALWTGKERPFPMHRTGVATTYGPAYSRPKGFYSLIGRLRVEQEHEQHRKRQGAVLVGDVITSPLMARLASTCPTSLPAIHFYSQTLIVNVRGYMFTIQKNNSK
jgi:hypothetical protein